MKKFLIAVLALFLLTATTSAEAKPVCIARLPIIFLSKIPDEETRWELETILARAVHVPLNETLQLVEYPPPNDSAQVLNNLWQNMRSKNKKARFQDAMRPLAKKLDADIIVCPILNRYSQNVSFNSTLDNENYMISYVRFELIIYDRRTNELIDKKATQMYNDAYSLRGTASFLSKICLNKVIDETKLRQRIIAIRK